MPHTTLDDFSVSAHKPWNSPYSGDGKKSEDIYGADDQEKIDKCISCDRAICINCLDKKAKYDKEKLFDMIIAGKRERLICTALGVSVRTVRSARKEIEEEMRNGRTDII